jgi:hypothetical protein
MVEISVHSGQWDNSTTDSTITSMQVFSTKGYENNKNSEA